MQTLHIQDLIKEKIATTLFYSTCEYTFKSDRKQLCMYALNMKTSSIEYAQLFAVC